MTGRLALHCTHEELGLRQAVADLSEALAHVRKHHPQASMEGSTGAQRSFWVSGKLVGFAWERTGRQAGFWVRVAPADDANAGPGDTRPAASVGPAVPAGPQLRAAREAAGLSQAQAAALLYRSARNWQQWELGERQMDPALWELFVLKTAGKAAG